MQTRRRPEPVSSVSSSSTPGPFDDVDQNDEVVEESDEEEVHDGYDEYLQAQLEEYQTISKGIDGLRFASELEPVQVVRTLFTSLNRASQVGGAPFRCMHVYHGPKHGGKTLLAMMNCISFTRNGHLAVWIDAERTFSPKFYADCGGDPALLQIAKPATYEEAINTVTAVINKFIAGKADGSIRRETAIIFVVDTINKLQPRNLLASVMKEEDLVKSYRMFGMTKAMVNQAWMDQLTPIIGDNDIAFVLIAQERKRQVEEAMAQVGKHRGGKKIETPVGEEEFKVKGGDAILFDNSFQVRISLASLVKETQGKDEVVVGKKHRGKVIKNKVGFPDEEFYFFTSNGRGDIPVGLDYEREAVEEAKQRGWVTVGGSWVSIIRPGEEGEEGVLLARGQGNHGLVRTIRENPEIFEMLVDSLNER